MKQTRRDQDSDHLKNLGEFRHGTTRIGPTAIMTASRRPGGSGRRRPRRRDSDDDGVDDGDENAGTVASFDGTTLTINLAAGGTISGLVTDRTEIKCETEGDDSGEDPSGTNRRGHHRRGSGDEGGEHHPGDDDSGHERGEDGEHHGEHGDCDEETACSVDDLVEGAVVHEAEIRVGGDGAVFKEIELIKSGDDSAG